MPSYKLGFWVRVFVAAPDLQTARQVRLLRRAQPPEGAEVADIEVEYEHISVFDDEGNEVARYDAENALIEPDSTSEEFGNTYT